MLVLFKNIINASCLALHEVNYIDSEVVYIEHRATFRVWIYDEDGDRYFCDSLTESDFITAFQFFVSKGFIDFRDFIFTYEPDD